MERGRAFGSVPEEVVAAIRVDRLGSGRKLVQRVLSPVAGPVARQRSTSAEIVSYLIVGILATSLAAMAAIQLRWALAFLQWPVEVMYGEALIYDHAARLL